jgi:methyltransferase (TIGR00027 family)
MTRSSTSIHHVSDTARWAAVYRARETERPDALFRDPFARRLAGEQGEQIARAIAFTDKNAWVWTTRTWLCDRLIEQQIRQGAQMVVNLAAGLDTRPYRMALPPSLTWVEVDLPGILDYKEHILAEEKAACTVERIRTDLADASARRMLLEKLKTKAQKAVIVSEGLLIYLSPEQVGALAMDLARVPAFRHWIFDIVSPSLLEMIRKSAAPQMSEGAAQMQFGPESGPEFFAPYGWTPVEVNPTLKTAAKLKRLSFFFRLIALLPQAPKPKGKRPWSAVCLLQNQA